MALVTQKEIIQVGCPHNLNLLSGGWHRSAFDVDVDATAELICEDGGFTAHLAADDLIQAVSGAAGDTTQTCYVRGIDTNGKVRIESFALNGTTAVDSAAKFRYVENAWLSAECAGAVIVRRKTGPANILAITIGQLQSYAVHHMNGENTTYITAICAGLGGTVADSVNLALRVYPDDTDIRDLADGFIKLIEPTIFFQAGTNEAAVANLGGNLLPQPIRVPKNSYIALYGAGEAANNDIWAFMQGFDIREE